MPSAPGEACNDAIEVRGLCKRYGSREVLSDLHLRVPAGRLFGFLGPNGAGKTTTLRILLGLVRASAGTASILGRDAWADGPRVRASVGYVPGDVRLYDGLTGRATLAFFDAARGRRCAAEIARLANAFELDLNQRVRRYSRGMKQKLALIQALMHRPAVLVLDEPTASLDPLVRGRLYGELRAATSEGRTVLFSSHTLSEVEELCDEVAILRAGRLVECERVEVLRARAVRRVEIVFNGSGETPPAVPEGLRLLERRGARVSGTWTGGAAPLLAWLARSGVRDVTIAPPDLEDLFLAYYADSPGATEGGT